MEVAWTQRFRSRKCKDRRIAHKPRPLRFGVLPLFFAVSFLLGPSNLSPRELFAGLLSGIWSRRRHRARDPPCRALRWRLSSAQRWVRGRGAAGAVPQSTRRTGRDGCDVVGGFGRSSCALFWSRRIECLSLARICGRRCIGVGRHSLSVARAAARARWRWCWQALRSPVLPPR